MEVEIKLRLPDAAAHHRLSSFLAPRLLRTDAQRNLFFDAAGRPLAAAIAALRVCLYGLEDRAPSHAVLALKRRPRIDAGVSRVEEVEEPLDPTLALACADDPARLGAVDSSIIRLVADEYGVGGQTTVLPQAPRRPCHELTTVPPTSCGSSSARSGGISGERPSAYAVVFDSSWKRDFGTSSYRELRLPNGFVALDFFSGSWKRDLGAGVEEFAALENYRTRPKTNFFGNLKNKITSSSPPHLKSCKFPLLAQSIKIYYIFTS